MEYRKIFLNREACIIHYPNRPNGFGILIISNDEKFSEGTESKWLLNQSRFAILQELVDKGYTIFYTNLGGNHLGNQKATDQVRHLYEYVKRTEILNEKIHVIAEGFGAIIVCSLMDNNPSFIRSALLINPIFSLAWVKELVHGQPFFYKRFLMDVSRAYTISEEKCENFIMDLTKGPFSFTFPFKIVHILEHGVQDGMWLRLYQTYLPDGTDNIHVLMPEKRNEIANIAQKLFEAAEIPL